MSSLMVAELSKLASEAVTTIVLPRLSSRFAACASMLDATILDVRKIASENPMMITTPTIRPGFLFTFRAPRIIHSIGRGSNAKALQNHVVLCAIRCKRSLFVIMTHLNWYGANQRVYP